MGTLFIALGLAVCGQAEVAMCQLEIAFDVPAYLEARETLEHQLNVAERAIEVVIPVSCWMSPAQRRRVSELRIDIGWTFEPAPVLDYLPRTAMQSDVSGVIAVESHDEDGGRVQTGVVAPLHPVTVQGQWELTKRSSTTTRMAVVPPHELLIASGTVARGTGAFFRFHTAPQVSLEGSRDVMVVYRVPSGWRGGLLEVTCQVTLPRKPMLGNSEPTVHSQTFSVPVYLQSDEGARRIARQYALADGALTSAWSRYRAAQSSSQFWFTATPRGSVFSGTATDSLRLERWLQGQLGGASPEPANPATDELRELARLVSEARSELQALTAR